MLAQIEIDQPIDKILDDWDFLEDTIVKKFSMWRVQGQNIFGIRRRLIGNSEVIDLKKGKFVPTLLGPSGIVGDNRTPMHCHVTTGGTPHRIRHSFGFWHVNDMDELYLLVPGVDENTLGYYVVMMQTPKGNEGESFAQYCEKCVTMIYETYCPTGKLGLEGMSRLEIQHIRDYNSDARHRTCPECGHLNPLAYAWNAAKDTPELATARAYW